jgi:lipid-A-disaccharide synthase
MRKFMESEQPQLVIAVDFPGFNLRLCKEAKRAGAAVMYYIAPQAWAWGRGRLKLMASVIDRLVVVFPFEVAFFRAAGIDAEFVGHPLLESVSISGEKRDAKQRLGIDSDRRLVALLPGSRVQEVRRLLPAMLEAALLLRQTYPVRIAIAAADSISDREIERAIAGSSGGRLASGWARVFRGVTSELLHASDVAVIASGSATLEAAIVGTPMVIVYRVSPASWAIARRIVSIDSIGLVNIVAGKKIVSEYLQDAVDPVRISGEMKELLCDDAKRSELIVQLRRVRDSLGEPGASEKAAAIALSMIGA